MHRASGHTLIRIIYLRRKRGSLQVWCIQAKKKKKEQKNVVSSWVGGG